MSTRTRLLGGALVAFLALSGASRSDTISFADAVSTLANDCGSDIKKFCKGLNLGSDRIQNCLEAHAAKVSPTCTGRVGVVGVGAVGFHGGWYAHPAARYGAAVATGAAIGAAAASAPYYYHPACGYYPYPPCY
ncbi:hypothetical protein HFO98_00075 [Rhizobium leguminosarum]|uniref:hypothetical protein n=1 Tax=Rhizobium leguminosarum TaxID=384 RepID=UPI001D2A092A|nr:hypothetical protein [Rhizobium leguminosarum]MBY5334362.1 hypothetical protein [Rhizobium leguminosarum]MBY5346010.1 hypothetical protein [Rhizobium leguminosarum]MBY5406891.1 hypothetical protein [Rhizobium leguminosarum]